MREMTPGSLSRLLSIRAFALDLDGTTWLGDRLLPGARELQELLDARGIPTVFVTNNSSHGRDDYVERLNALGLPTRPREVLTSGEATIAFLRHHRPGARVFLVGTPSLVREFHDGGIGLAEDPREADTVVLGFDTGLTYGKMRDLCDLVRRGVFFVATHPDVNCPVPDGYLPDVGSFLALVEASTGRRPDEVIGKPGPRMIEVLSARLGQPPDRIAFVGDRLYTDVRMARTAGMLAVLVLSGETRVEDVTGSPCHPDLVVQDLVELHRLLAGAAGEPP